MISRTEMSVFFVKLQYLMISYIAQSNVILLIIQKEFKTLIIKKYKVNKLNELNDKIIKKQEDSIRILKEISKDKDIIIQELKNKLNALEKQLILSSVVLSNRYKTEEFSIYTPKDDECVVVIEDSFKHKRTFDINDFNKLMSVLHSVQDY